MIRIAVCHLVCAVLTLCHCLFILCVSSFYFRRVIALVVENRDGIYLASSVPPPARYNDDDDALMYGSLQTAGSKDPPFQYQHSLPT